VKGRILIDVLYRAAEVRELKADVQEREGVSWTGNQSSTATTLKNQTLWYGKTVWAGATYVQAVYAETKPDWMNEVRALKFGLSGIVLQTGIKIRL